jgi:hypothetical protein
MENDRYLVDDKKTQIQKKMLNSVPGTGIEPALRCQN